MTDRVDAKAAPSAARKLLLGVLSFSFVAGVLLNATGVIELNPEALAQALRGYGPWGAVLLVAIFAAGAIAQIPGVVFIAAAVSIYGDRLGYLVALLGAMAAVNLSFGLARWTRIGDAAVLDRPLLRRVVSWLDRYPILSIAVLRALVLVSPPVNYALALTRLKHRDFAIGSALGLLVPMWVLTRGLHCVLG